MDNGDRSGFDHAFLEIIKHLGQRASRRSLLERLAKVLLGALGFTFIPVLPLNRIMGGRISSEVEAQSCSCNDPSLCGICGKPCCACTGGSLTSCANNTAVDSSLSWMMCCNGVYYEYDDCCYLTPPGPPPTCSTLFCDAHCRSGFNESPWCATDVPQGKRDAYGCTIANAVGGC
jgi:hypothetical protein